MTETLGPYELKRPLGRGGMGEVHLARDPRLDRDVALKVLPEDLKEDGDRRMRFLREAKAAASLNHANITTIYEVGEADTRDYIAFEYVEGQTLQQRLLDKPLTVDEIVGLAVPMAEALAYAHEQGIIHRDLKSANVMVTPRGVPKLLDFGLAKLMADESHQGQQESTTLTLSGAIFGTPGAMSPEQALGKPVDARSDVFSFGSLLYEMCCGRPPFKGETAMETMDQVIHAEPPALTSLRRDLPAALSDIVAKAQRKDPDERYQSMAGLAADLRHLKRTTDSGLIPPAQARPRGPAGRWAAAVVVLLLVAAGVFAWRGGWLGPSDAGVEAAPAATDADLVAVMYFANLADPADEDRLGAMLARLLTTHLDTGDDVHMLSQQRLYDVAKRVGSTDGSVDRSIATEVAKTAGVSSMITGEVVQVGGRLMATVEISDVATGRSLGRTKAQGAGPDDLFAMAETLGGQVRDILGAPASEGERAALEQQLTSSVEAYRAYVRGQQAMDRGDFKAAVEAFDRATEIDPSFALANYWNAAALGWMGREADQRLAIERAIAFRDRLPPEIQRVLDAAKVYVAGDFAGALPLLEEVVAEDPDNKYALYLLGEVYIHSAARNDVAKGVACFARVLELDPGFHFIYEHLWSSLLYDGRPEEARVRLDAWEDDEPELVRAMRAVSDAEEGRVEALRGIESRALPNNWTEPIRRVLEEDWLGDELDVAELEAILEASEEDFDRAGGEEVLEGFYELVYRGRRAEAVALEQVRERKLKDRLEEDVTLDIAPDSLMASMMGLFRHRSARAHWPRNPELARELMEESVELQPDAARWRYVAAAWAARSGDLDRAREHVAHLEELSTRGWSPTYPLYRDAAAAEVALAEGRAAEAQRLYAGVVGSGRLRADFWAYTETIGPVWREGLARACTAAGDLEAAAEAWRGLVDSGVERVPYPDVWVPALYELGVVELERGRTAEGRASLERYLDYWGDSEDGYARQMAKDARARLAEL